MKFYVYIADAELHDILASLTPDERDRLARELEMDPELLARAAVRKADSDETRFARAVAVARHLETGGHAGPLESEAPFIADHGALRWGRVRRVRGRELIRHDSESPVSFGLAKPTRELIMAGSSSKLLAQPPAATFDLAAQSAPPGFAWFALAQRADSSGDFERRCLDQLFEATPPPARASEAPSWARGGTPKAPRALSAHTLGTLRSEPWMERLASARSEVSALPEGRLEVLAKRLATFSGGRVDPSSARFEPAPALVVAAPLCVAMIV